MYAYWSTRSFPNLHATLGRQKKLAWWTTIFLCCTHRSIAIYFLQKQLASRTILGNQSQFGLFRLSQKPVTICHHTTQTAAIARKRFQLQHELSILHGSLEHLLQSVLQRFKLAAAQHVRHWRFLANRFRSTILSQIYTRHASIDALAKFSCTWFFDVYMIDKQ